MENYKPAPLLQHTCSRLRKKRKLDAKESADNMISAPQKTRIIQTEVENETGDSHSMVNSSGRKKKSVLEAEDIVISTFQYYKIQKITTVRLPDSAFTRRK